MRQRAIATYSNPWGTGYDTVAIKELPWVFFLWYVHPRSYWSELGISQIKGTALLSLQSIHSALGILYHKLNFYL